jgi:hypothetical protein
MPRRLNEVIANHLFQTSRETAGLAADHFPFKVCLKRPLMEQFELQMIVDETLTRK